MNIQEHYGRKYDMDSPVDITELIFDANFGLDNDIESIIEKIGGHILRVWNRAKKLGWIYTGEAHNGAGYIETVMLDPQRKKHWLRFNEITGEATFAPVTMKCF